MGVSRDYAVGDFDGDGYLDRLRVEPRSEAHLSLYFAKGDGSKYFSEKLISTVRIQHSNMKPKMGSIYVPSKQKHEFGYANFGFWVIDISPLDLESEICETI